MKKKAIIITSVLLIVTTISGIIVYTMTNNRIPIVEITEPKTATPSTKFSKTPGALVFARQMVKDMYPNDEVIEKPKYQDYATYSKQEAEKVPPECVNRWCIIDRFGDGQFVDVVRLERDIFEAEKSVYIQIVGESSEDAARKRLNGSNRYCNSPSALKSDSHKYLFQKQIGLYFFSGSRCSNAANVTYPIGYEKNKYFIEYIEKAEFV